MRWDKELDNKLKILINQNKKHEEIANILGLTIKSISNRCFRLGLKIKHKKKYKCKNCQSTFEDYYINGRKFCSKKCSITFNNIGTKHSIETRQKISSKISGPNNPNWVDGRSLNKNLNKQKICKNCNEVITKKYVRICDNCRIQYYKYYRPLCEFDFIFDDYKEFFSMELIKEYGWYSPSNRGNNLKGVSRDHLFSVSDGFKNGVNPEIIKHPANCRLVLHTENNIKNNSSLISLDELNNKIKLWDKKII